MNPDTFHLWNILQSTFAKLDESERKVNELKCVAEENENTIRQLKENEKSILQRLGHLEKLLEELRK